MTKQELRDWIGSDWLKVDHLLDLLHEALNDEDGAEMMRRDVEAYTDRCEQEDAA
jgi:hypothetical protein